MIIEIDGIPIELLKKPIKNVHLRIYPPDGTVRVSVPLIYNEQLIRQQLYEKRVWIQRQRQRIQKQCSIKEEPILQTGTLIPFKGTDYHLIIEEHHGSPHIKINNQWIHCYVPPHSSATQIKAALEHWYKKEMALLIPTLIEHWEQIIPVKVAQWGIRAMKTRWGSCNTRTHRISLNLSLIKKPLICLEYVLVHELVHLMEASHNRRFYALMTQFMPQWQDYKSILEGKN